jgi:NIPSNAP
LALEETTGMITLCIRYTIDQNQYRNFEKYVRAILEPIRGSGGELVGYFLPTKLAGPTNIALALINFSSLDAYEKYRDAFGADAAAVASVSAVEKSGCILCEDRSFLRGIV